MKKCHFLLLFCLNLMFSQEKSKYVFNNETLKISLKEDLEIESFIEQKKHIVKSKDQHYYTESIGYNSFNEISEIKGNTLNVETQKKTRLNSFYISTYDAVQENIFHSDYKVKNFRFPNVEDNSDVEFSYINTYKEPRLLTSFNFQEVLKTEKSIFKIICDPFVEIGYKLFGNHQDKIIFTKTQEGKNTIYTWEAKDIPAFEAEESMPSFNYFAPHVVYYIKSYEKTNVKKELLGNPKNLYLWYASLVKDINKTDQSELKIKTLELIKDKNSDLEKAKSIFHWIQENLHYVAFEDGMGGFIPRNASDVYQKKYGDCKDMANLMTEMFKIAGLKSNLTWIGTRHKPYSYNDVPSPVVDNHMISSVLIDEVRYFLDATDKFCPFPFPSKMIQGKEALIGLSEQEFLIEKVPIIDSDKNTISADLDLKIEGTDLIGTVKSAYNGYNKSNLLNYLSHNSAQEKEIWKSFLVYSNEKIVLDNLITERNAYKNIPATASYDLKIENWIKNLEDKILVKPILLFPFRDSSLDLEKRKYDLEKDNAYQYEINYSYSIPENYSVDFIPENASSENELLTFNIQYKVIEKKIEVKQKVISKKLIIEKKDFENWNLSIKSLNKNYNQSIILKK